MGIIQWTTSSREALCENKTVLLIEATCSWERHGEVQGQLLPHRRAIAKMKVVQHVSRLVERVDLNDPASRPKQGSEGFMRNRDGGYGRKNKILDRLIMLYCPTSIKQIFYWMSRFLQRQRGCSRTFCDESVTKRAARCGDETMMVLSARSIRASVLAKKISN